MRWAPAFSFDRRHTNTHLWTTPHILCCRRSGRIFPEWGHLISGGILSVFFFGFASFPSVVNETHSSKFDLSPFQHKTPIHSFNLINLLIRFRTICTGSYLTCSTTNVSLFLRPLELEFILVALNYLRLWITWSFFQKFTYLNLKTIRINLI